MKINPIEKKIKQIRKKINDCNKKYYDLNASDISDIQYDSLMQDLIELERVYPHLVTPDSPTQKIGGFTNSVFTKERHKPSMQSLSNAFNFDDLIKFDRTIKNNLKLKKMSYFCEYKIDGLSVSLIYENGILKQALTRGDGVFGENITKNVKLIKSIPHTIKCKSKIVVRGEIYVKKSIFRKINEHQEKNNKKVFSNPRNLAAGTIRQLNPEIVKKRELSVFFYFAYYWDSNFQTQKEILNFLEKEKFSVNSKFNKLVDSINGGIECIDDLKFNRDKLDYEVDGVVIKVNDLKYHSILGNTSKFPKWAIAYKFLSPRSRTLLLNIFPTVGRTGKITYNAKLQAVEIAGSIVRAATLHNADYIINNDIRIGDFVFVKKAGDIIPKVIMPILEDRKSNCKPWSPNLLCPSCNKNLVKPEGLVDQYCLNISCKVKQLRLIEHFSSKKGMNIHGLNTKILNKLWNLDYLKSFSSIYKLKNVKSKLIKLNSFGEKSISNLLNSIENSKQVTLSKFIFALGINYVGEYISEILSKKIKNMDSLIRITKKELLEIKGMGPIAAESLIQYFKISKNIQEIDELINLGITFKQPIVSSNKLKFEGYNFVISGKLSKTRSFFEQEIKANGGHFSNIITLKTDFLLLGEESGSKYLHAKKIGINIISELEYTDLLKGKKNINEFIQKRNHKT